MFAGEEAATSEVASQVVGFTTTDTGNNQFMLGIGFEALSTDVDGIKLGDLQGEFEQGDNIQELFMEWDEESQTYLMSFRDFYYKRVSGKWGWYDEDNQSAKEKTFKPGAAVYFISAGDAKPLTQAGGVRKDTYEHPAFDESVEMLASAFPCGFNPNADAVHFEGLDQGDNIQVQYVYHDEEVDADLLGFTDYYYKRVSGKWAWYDEDNQKVTESIVLPGQGFYFLTDGDPSEKSLTEDSPLAPAEEVE